MEYNTKSTFILFKNPPCTLFWDILYVNINRLFLTKIVSATFYIAASCHKSVQNSISNSLIN